MVVFLYHFCIMSTTVSFWTSRMPHLLMEGDGVKNVSSNLNIQILFESLLIRNVN